MRARGERAGEACVGLQGCMRALGPLCELYRNGQWGVVEALAQTNEEQAWEGVDAALQERVVVEQREGPLC